MSVKISLDNVISNTSEFSLDFLFLKISGNADVNARLTFLSIMELERYNQNPYLKFLDCLTNDEKMKIADMEIDEATAFIESKFLKEDFPPIESLSNSFIKAIGENKTIYTNKLFLQIIQESISNSSFSIEFNADGEKDGLSLDAKQNLTKEIQKCSTIAEIADLVFSYYKKNIKLIYVNASNSVIGFLESLK